MSIVRIAHSGYGMLERNRVDTVIMESQCALDTTAFPTGAEVGMIVAVDKTAGKIKLTGDLKGLLANSEMLYDQFKPGLKNYKVEAGAMASVLILRNGTTFTTNTVCYDTTDYAAETDLTTALRAVKTTPLYGKQDSNSGAIQITATKGTCALEVVGKTTMPDGQNAVKFIVINEAGL